MGAGEAAHIAKAEANAYTICACLGNLASFLYFPTVASPAVPKLASRDPLGGWLLKRIFGYWIFGYWIFGYWVLDIEPWTLDIWIWDIGYCISINNMINLGKSYLQYEKAY